MPAFRPEPPHTHGSQPKTGILLVNLGTPDEPTPAAVRRYLKEFLSDQRVVEIPRAIWWLILNGIILNVRPKKTAAKYQSIWLKEGSPLRVYTERQAQMLKGYLGETLKSPFCVAAAMRYGNPSIEAGIATLKGQQCDNILVLPLYPQYAASTTASTFDQLARVLMRQRNVPGIRLVRSFHDHPAYIEALARNVRAAWMKLGRPDFTTDKLLMTFHGLPRFHLDQGDPYHCHCHKTARLLAEALGLAPDHYRVTFQSRFGRAEWLQPYTDQTLAALGQAGVKRVDVICPGFAADCLETLEEIGMEAKHTFLSAGGHTFHYLPVANDSEAFVGALTEITREHLQGWISEPWDRDAAARQNQLSQERAKALGAVS
ncbi:MAG: ferrochelatase [Betaproteobacteria bacterium]|nr:ferrochelatase [Betaproteobacteria bacterium]